MVGKFLWLVVGLVWLGAGCASASAIAADAVESKLVAVVSISSLDAAFTDITEVLKVFGEPEIVKSAKLMKSVFTRGIAPAKPIGIFVVPDATQEKLCIIASIPIDDLKAIQETFKPQDDGLTDLGEGVIRLSVPGFDVFAKERGDTLLVTAWPEDLAVAPKETVKLLGDLPQKADIVISVDLGNLPEAMKGMGPGDLMTDILNTPPELRERNRAFNDEFNKNFRGVNALEMRLTRNPKTEVLTHATVIRFVPDSDFHENFVARRNMQSDASNFVSKDSVASFLMVSKLKEETKEMLQTGAVFAFGMVTSNQLPGKLSVEMIEKRSEAHSRASRLLWKSFDESSIDIGASLSYEPQNLSFVMSTRIGESEELRDILKELSEIPVEQGEAKLVLDVEKHRGVAFHTITMPIPASRKGLSKLIGEEFSMVIGTGNGRAYFAAGRNPQTTLKKHLDKPSPAKDETESSFSLAPVKLANIYKETDSSLAFNKWYDETLAKKADKEARISFTTELRKDMHITKIQLPLKEYALFVASQELLKKAVSFEPDPVEDLTDMEQEDGKE